MRREEAIEFYKGERERFEKSREIQWKFDLAVWTLIALGIHFLDNNKIAGYRLLISLLCLAYLISHFIFCYLIQRGLVAARNRSDSIMNKLNESNSEVIDMKAQRLKLKLHRADWYWIGFQVGATVILLGVFLIRISVKG